MFYIDDYNSKTVTNNPPAKKVADFRKEWESTKQELNKKQLTVFWYLAGVVIAHNFEEVKTLLSKYGFDVTSEQDAAVAISSMLGTQKWPKFVNEFGDLMEETIDERVLEELKESSEESGWVEALIQAVGSVASSSLSLAASKKAQDAAKENAKATMFSGISNALAEREKVKAEMEKTKREGKKGIVWIIIAVLLLVGIIVGIVIYKNRKAKAA